MKLNYSYKAFLITSLLVGNLVLLLISVKLNDQQEEVVETVPVEYLEIFPEEEEELALSEPLEKVTIQTHSAFNEAENFIREIENSRNAELEEEITSSSTEYNFESTGSDTDFSKAQDKLEEVKEKLAEAAKKKKVLTPKSVNRKTTISYRLVDRKAVSLPNPVYICDAGGKIVISIEVNALGQVVNAVYNPTLSTTSNGCLIDAALEYAQGAEFNSKVDKQRQLGTISYLFPGQE